MTYQQFIKSHILAVTGKGGGRNIFDLQEKVFDASISL
jgi:hypothetical protein